MKCVKLSICGFMDEKLKTPLQKLGCLNWGVDLIEGNYLDKYDKKQIVYLTADAEQEISEIEQDKVYVIGGLVDHNRIKRATLNKAQAEGV